MDRKPDRRPRDRGQRARARRRRGLCGARRVSLGAWRDRRHALPPVAATCSTCAPGRPCRDWRSGSTRSSPTSTGSGAIQHFGGTRRAAGGDKSYRLLYPLLDLTTTLDPHFSVAYRFGAIFLAEPYPSGPGRADQAIALLERGLAADPTKWQDAQDVGFVYYWWVSDYKTAAQWFDRASRIEGAPWWLRSMAATTLAEGGDRQSSRQLWQQLYETRRQRLGEEQRAAEARADRRPGPDGRAGRARPPVR